MSLLPSIAPWPPNSKIWQKTTLSSHWGTWTVSIGHLQSRCRALRTTIHLWCLTKSHLQSSMRSGGLIWDLCSEPAVPQTTVARRCRGPDSILGIRNQIEVDIESISWLFAEVYQGPHVKPLKVIRIRQYRKAGDTLGDSLLRDELSWGDFDGLNSNWHLGSKTPSEPKWIFHAWHAYYINQKPWFFGKDWNRQ